MSAERPFEPVTGDPRDQASGERAELVERLFREHNEALVRFLMARLRSYQDAREVAQEAYVRLLSLDELGTISYLRAFLFKTAANLAVDRRRQAAVHARATELPLFHEFVDARTPERRAADRQTIQRLERLIAAMPAKCRQAYVWYAFDGLEIAAISKRMSISPRMVHKYIVRALLHCRAQLDLDDSPDRGAGVVGRAK